MIKILIILIILLWVLIDLFSLFTVTKSLKTQLLFGRIICIKKNTGYHKSTLHLKVQCSENKVIETTSFFKPNLRWWMQNIPKPGDIIYFHIMEKPYTKDNDDKNIVAFNVTNHKPNVGRLRWDLFAYHTSTRTIIFFTILFLCLFIVLKFTPYAIYLPKEFYFFLILRLTIEVLII